MDKLTEKNKEKLKNIIQTATLIDIESLLIDAESVRGISIDKKVLLIDKKNVLDDIDQIGSVAITRSSLLNMRLNLMKSTDYTVSYSQKIKDNKDKIIEKFVLKSGKTTVEFRCGDPNMIASKKSLSSPLVYDFQLSKETVDLMIKANSAMQNDDSFSFSLNENGEVIFKLSDKSGDQLSHVVCKNVLITDDLPPFFFTYDKKIGISLIKHAIKENDSIKLSFTQRGMMNLFVNDFNLYLAPELT